VLHSTHPLQAPKPVYLSWPNTPVSLPKQYPTMSTKGPFTGGPYLHPFPSHVTQLNYILVEQRLAMQEVLTAAGRMYPQQASSAARDKDPDISTY